MQSSGVMYILEWFESENEVGLMNNTDGMPDLATTSAFRMQRKAVKEIFYNRPEGIGRSELASLALAKGIGDDDFQKVLASLLASGHLYYDEAVGRYRFVRNE